MYPSDHSHSNHTQTDLSPALGSAVPRDVHRSCGRLRHLLAGSPDLNAESSSLAFGTNLPSPAAPHPVSRRRSCLRLHAGVCLQREYDFHILSSWFHGRTRSGFTPRCAARASCGPERSSCHPISRTCVFAGIRPSNDCGAITPTAGFKDKDRLIDLKANVIRITLDIAKTRDVRQIVIQPNLLAGLERYAIDRYPIIPRNVLDFLGEVRKEFGIADDVLGS